MSDNKAWFEDGFSVEDVFYQMAENCYLGVEFENVQAPISSTYTREFDMFSDFLGLRPLISNNAGRVQFWIRPAEIIY